MTAALPIATFRDPAGSLSFDQQHAIRTIHPSSREAVLEFLRSSFCTEAQERGELISAEIDSTADTSHALRLRHPRIPIPTYPWEWTPSQWLAAAGLTLALAQRALAHGWILKDATPLNILFIGNKPLFVDILSFERHIPGSSVWLAYGQYIRTFLLPLLTHRLLHWPLELTLFRRDGYEPSELYGALTWAQRLAPAAFWPITLPALVERRQMRDTQSAASPKQPRQFPAEAATAILSRTLTSLERRTRNALPPASCSNWSDYPSTLTHYTPDQSQAKANWVRQTLTHLQPRQVLDIGANTGEFSALAASLGASVVALERDQAAADRLFRMTRDRDLSILPIHADIARPTPAVGWLNSEASALLPRLEGQFDCVLVLAVIHHLILMEQIPIPAILFLFHRLTRRHLILEWVPNRDPMYQSLMRGRDTLYGSLAEADLLQASNGLFRPIDRHQLTNNRVLFLFEKLT